MQNKLMLSRGLVGKIWLEPNEHAWKKEFIEAESR